MSLLRLVVVALPMFLLASCNGSSCCLWFGDDGEGGGATSTTASISRLSLPPLAIDDPTAVIVTVTGDTTIGSPPNSSSNEIEGKLQGIAADASSFLFSDIIHVSRERDAETPVCGRGSCAGVINDGTRVQFSLSDFGGTPGVDGEALAGYNIDYMPEMSVQEYTIGQARAAGRNGEDGARFQFQSYGGWNDFNVFAVQLHESNDGVNVIQYLTAYSLGDGSGRDFPSGTTRTMVYGGTMVGAHTQTGNILQGNSRITANPSTSRVDVSFQRIVDLTAEGLNNPSSMTWNNLTIVNGTFEGATDASGANATIEGAFYGSEHEAVGGIFEHLDNSIVGAFGGKR